MKSGIFAKLFLILLLNLLVILAVNLASVQWSFKQGFNDYLLKAEASQLDKLINILEQSYAIMGSWEKYQQDRGLWFGVLRQGLGDEHLPPEFHKHDHDFPPHPPRDRDEPFHHHPPPGPPPRGAEANEAELLARFLGSRVYLLNAEKQPIAGEIRSSKNAFLRPLKQDGQVVGWLGLQASDLISDHLAGAFVNQQMQTNLINAGLAIGLAVFSSLLLTRKLVVPVKKLTAGANALVAGDFTTQIAVTSQDELGQLAEDFNLLARTLQNNEQMRRQWIADISHELRTPLAILRAEIEAAQDGIREINPKSIQSLHTEVMSLTGLVNDLYDLSITDLGMVNNNTQRLDVLSELDEVLASQVSRFKARGLEIRYQFRCDSPVFVVADTRRIHQLFSNLMENSLRYTFEGGFCDVSVYCTQDNVFINFQDSAPAVPDESLTRLFDRLYRVDQSRNRASGGAGLGLAICEAIVNAHQGSIRALHSRYGGLSIEVTLPLAKQE